MSNDKMREAAKKLATEFFYWWHNQPGSNTQSGFDDFAETGKGRELMAALHQQAESEPAALSARLALDAIRYADEEGPRQYDREYLDLVAEYIERNSNLADSQQAESAEPVAWFVEGKALIGRFQKTVFNPDVAREYAKLGNTVIPLCKCTHQPAVPEGWTALPNKLPEEVLVAGLKEADQLGGLTDWNGPEATTRTHLQEVWDAMRAAAPEDK
jgi:hypothetical protein